MQSLSFIWVYWAINKLFPLLFILISLIIQKYILIKINKTLCAFMHIKYLSIKRKKFQFFLILAKLIGIFGYFTAKTAISCYQAIISPLLPKSCVYFPSCSNYALQALKKHGFWRGSLMTIRRLASCHNFNKKRDYYDPVA